MASTVKSWLWVGLGAALAVWPAGGARADKAASTDKLGTKIERVMFRDAAGKPFALHDVKDKKAVVAVFLSFDCPVCTSYCPVLAELARIYEPRGVAFIGITTNEDEDAAQVARHAAEYKLPFPVFLDKSLKAADALKAVTTPEAFVLDRFGILRYRGRIDDAYSARLKRKYQINRHDLRAALDEILVDKPVSQPATVAVGCPISRDLAGRQTDGKVTYYRDVLPIVQNHCQQCHRPGEVGPFSLMTYKQAVNWASDIKEYAQSRQMPPWKPVEGKDFLNDRRITDKEIATLAAWVDGGTPAGNPKDAPSPRTFVKGWQLGQPDLVLTAEGEMQVSPSGKDLFRCYVLPTHLTEDKYVTAVEVRPGNPRIVHHTLQFIDTNGQGRKLEQKEKERVKKPDELDIGPGYSSAMGVGFIPRGGLGGWAPGQMVRHLPEGTGHLLPKGADVVMQVHYHRDGRLEKDRTQIGLYFAKKPVSKPYQGLVVAGGGNGRGRVRFFMIPAGAAHHRIQGSMWVEQDCVIHSVMPHMHLLGKEIKVTMTPPGGAMQTLVHITDWDYNWQETYWFKQPIAVKAGTRFDVEAYYDNSEANPNNPSHPPRLVTFGEQTTNEMCFGFIGATSDRRGRIRMRFDENKAEEKAGEKVGLKK